MFGDFYSSGVFKLFKNFGSLDISKSHQCYEARTTDTRRLNPKFFAAQIQIQIPIPNKYLGCGYKDLVFVEIVVE